MSVIFDQLRISDNGQLMFIDAHISDAEYFDNLYISRVFISTEDQVKKLNPIEDGYIYNGAISTGDIHRIYEEMQLASDTEFGEMINQNGGWNIDYTSEAVSTAVKNIISFGFQNKLNDIADETPLKLLITTSDFDPTTDDTTSTKVLGSVDGEEYVNDDETYWTFTGKVDIALNTDIAFYIYKYVSEEWTLVQLTNSSADTSHAHLAWQIWAIDPIQEKRSFSLVLNKNSFNEHFTAGDLSHNMFFVYVECQGTPAPNTPCALDDSMTLAVTFDYGLIYNQGMKFTRELADSCTIPSDFIDFILNLDALKMSIETDNYFPAIDYFKALLNYNYGNSGSSPKPCGCHG